MKKIYLLAILIALGACMQQPSIQNEWHVVLKTDKDGTVLQGSKQKLMNAIRNGQDLKIGWGVKREDLSIEHLSAPIWLAILSEKEVMTHLDPQVLSNITWDSLAADYKDFNLLQQEWRVVLTTKGDFDAVWYDRKADTVIKRWPQKHRMTWFANGNAEIVPPALFDE